MRLNGISLTQVRQLAPGCLNLIIPESWSDNNGHMNMRWYVAIFDDAGDELHARLGLEPGYHRQHQSGTFDLEHHTHFLSEVMPGDRVTVYVRIVGHSPKRVHYVMFLVNETRKSVAALFECVNSFVDLRIRRTAPWPPEIASKIEAAFSANSDLDWPPPVCGVMSA